jgi:crotonobetainyl-CoA:carnitine CoA-transferase CaiB-like acyl-CoA transferase
MNTPLPHQSALQDIRVIDLTTVVFGPYATQTLADYGADVVKIEAPDGDSTRFTGPADERGMSSLFLGANRNKRSVVLNLKEQADREALLALTDRADVFIHNVRPQKLERLGLAPDVLCTRNPRLIYVGLHGFGEGGPYAGLPAYDDIIQALSGAADLMNRQSGTPGYFPTIAADKTCSHMAVHAVLAALYQRERTGQGQFIEVPMFESMVSYLLVEHFYARHLPKADPAAQATSTELGYPRTLASWRRPYRTADGYACIMPYTDENWQRFFQAANRPDLADDARFARIAGRTQHIAALYALTAEIVEQETTAHWLSLCSRLEVPCAPINRLEDLEQDPHLRAVGFFESLASNPGADYCFPRSPIRLSKSYVAPAMPPRLGQHTEEVLRQAGLRRGASPPADDAVPGPMPTTDGTAPH